MPSPFPGMDPYLESPQFFPGLHDSMVTHLKDLLQGVLPDHYFADIRSRVWIEYSERIVEPDVNVLRARPSEAGESGMATATAVSVTVQPVKVLVPREERQTSVEIRTVRGERRLVTAIEILSPSNKTPGDHSQRRYREKQQELLSSQTNLVEIDLLRGGEHTTAVPRELAIAQAGPFDYHVSIRRFDDLAHRDVYPIRLEQRLPQIAIPLLPGDQPVPLDLQAVFERAYAGGPYRKLRLYADTRPEPPLTPPQAQWANAILRDKGFLLS